MCKYAPQMQWPLHPHKRMPRHVILCETKARIDLCKAFQSCRKTRIVPLMQWGDNPLEGRRPRLRPVRQANLASAVIGKSQVEMVRFDNSTDLARQAEAWGYHRYWLAEHHNMPGIASAATAVLIGHIASQTKSIRVGAGGIMLPNSGRAKSGRTLNGNTVEKPYFDTRCPGRHDKTALPPENASRSTALLCSGETLVERDALIVLAKSPFPQPFDLVFIDPPFATSLAQAALTALVAGALLAPGAKVYVEVPQGAELSLPDGFEALRQTQAGESVAQLVHWTPPRAAPEAGETRL